MIYDKHSCTFAMIIYQNDEIHISEISCQQKNDPVQERNLIKKLCAT